MAYTVLLYLHIIGATVILGTGAGIAFFMLMAHLSKDATFIAKTAGVVVLADLLFTATAVVVEPITGYLLLRETGIPVFQRWVLLSIVLYIVAGVFWLPVAAAGQPLPPRYRTLFRLWFAFGFPGFGAVMAIVWLMIDKPSSEPHIAKHSNFSCHLPHKYWSL